MFDESESSTAEGLGAALPRFYQLVPLGNKLAGPQGASRQQRAPDKTRTFELDAEFERAGVWAGVEQLAERAYSDVLEIGQGALVEEHLYELYMVLPKHHENLRPSLCLADTSLASEQTRLYPVDRAYRIVHGLVSFILKWRRAVRDQGTWLVVVRNVDKAQHLATRFFAELARRAASDGHIMVLVGAGSGWAASSLNALGVAAVSPGRWEVEPSWYLPPPDRLDESEMGPPESQNPEIDGTDSEAEYPKLLAYYKSAGNRLAAARTALRMLTGYNRCGYFHEGASFISLVLEHVDDLAAGSERGRLRCLKEVYACLVSCGQADRAIGVILDLAVPCLTEPGSLADLDYILGVHYVRYAKTRSFELSERHLLSAIDNIRLAKESYNRKEYLFKKVFADNALALLRSRQGRDDEAINLCQAGYAALTSELGEQSYLLHRSVLQYNTAQACMVSGRVEEALVYYANAVAMDPCYSEYHNEIGNILQGQGNYDDALGSYCKAIMYSPPYPEVYFNKALCHARQGRHDDALDCLAISLELRPDQPDVHAVRAEVLSELGRADEALADYDCAIALGYNNIAARINRAAILFHTRAYEPALGELDIVIAQDPDEAEHYVRRAAIHEAMNRQDLYRRDLDSADRCRGNAQEAVSERVG
jgi:tetratricopeptide (TPR) repeat protein